MANGAMTAREKAERIKEKVTMQDVLGRYGLELDRHGKMLCPFHAEDTASFSVEQNGKRWFCFGCHKSGSVIDFVMEYHNINFTQALVRLNDEFNLGLWDNQMPVPKKNLMTAKLKRETETAIKADRKYWLMQEIEFRRLVWTYFPDMKNLIDHLDARIDEIEACV